MIEKKKIDLEYSQLESDRMRINMGPQHPSTHGVLKLEVEVAGEIVTEVVPHLGYLHRCFEKYCEKMTYQQILPYIDRMDYISAMAELGYPAVSGRELIGMPLPEGDFSPDVFIIKPNRSDGNR